MSKHVKMRKGLGSWLCRHGLHCWEEWIGFDPFGRWAVRRVCLRRGCGKAEWT